MKKVSLVVLLSLFVCTIAQAANFTGKWGGMFPYRDSVIMKLNQNGKKLKGKITGSDGEYDIQGRVDEDIATCTIIFIKNECNSCDDSYSATMELLDKDTLLMVFDGVDCYGDGVDNEEQEFIRY